MSSKTDGLWMNGQFVPRGQIYRPVLQRAQKPKPMVRIFDHLTDEPEAAYFRSVARFMKTDRWWTSVPEYDEPKPVSGEILCRA